MSRQTSSSSRGRRLLDWKGVLGILVSIALLWYAFRGVDLGEVARGLRRADLPLLGLAAAMVTLPFVLRAIRWRALLQPVHPGSRFRPRFAATSIGFMVNNLLPARIGEFARAYALSRLESIRVSASFGSLVVERIFDGITIVALLLLSMAAPSFPELSGRDFGAFALWLGLVFVCGFVVLLAMVVRPRRSVAFFERWADRLLPERVRRTVVDMLEAFLEGMGSIRDWRLVARAAGWSIAVWLTTGLGTWIAFRAFEIDAPFVAAVFLQSLIALAVALPSAPGFFGLFEAAARVGLVEVWGVESTRAVTFAVGLHLAGFIPVTVIGLYYAWRLGLSWRDVERSEEVVEEAVEEEEVEDTGGAADTTRGTAEGTVS